MERKPYPTDLTDAEFALVSSLLPAEKPENSRGRNPLYTHRELLNAILYHLRVGGAWRTLPHDLPHWNSVYAYFRRWSENGVLDRIVETLRARIRVEMGKAPTPSVAILDSQSVKTTSKGGIQSRRALDLTPIKRSKGANATSP